MQQQHRRARGNAPMRPAAPDWSKLLKAGPGQAGQGGTTTPPSPNLEEGDAADASRPISRASSSYFLGAASRRSSTTSLTKLGEQATWQSSDIEEFLRRRSTDADSGAGVEFERWAATSRAHTSYQLPLFTLPADSKALQPRPSSSFQRGALQQKEEVVGQLRALQQAAAQLLSEGDQQREEEQEEEPAAGEPRRPAGASAAAGATQQQQQQQQQKASQPAVPTPSPAAGAGAAAAAAAPSASPRPGSFALLPPASPGMSPFATPGKPAGGARRAAAVPSKPAGSPAYGCITTPRSAVVARQAGGSSAAGKAGSRAPASPGVSSITDHLQQLKLLQQQAQKLFG